MKPLINGILTGLLLQLAIGPVFFFILEITMSSSYFNALFAVLGVTLADYCYIALSILGVGKTIESPRAKKTLGLVSAAVLIAFGILALKSGISGMQNANAQLTSHWTPSSSFVGCFILTMSSPLTIVFWGSVFSAKAVELNYGKKQLAFFGTGAGLATFLFMSSTMFALAGIKASIPLMAVRILNLLVGLAIVYYGVARAIRIMHPKR